jgi:hypothetical protein
MKDTAPFSETAPSTTDSVLPSWTRKFALIEQAGGPKLPDAKKLKTGERMAVLFNIWGFLFRPVYYLVKGMWKKAVTLTVFGLGIVFVAMAALTMAGIDAERPLRFVIPTLFAVRATIDYYKKVVLKDNGWW